MSSESEELARQVARLSGVVDELARASLAQANATNMLQQVLREMAKDQVHIKDRIETIVENTKPRGKLKAASG